MGVHEKEQLEKMLLDALSEHLRRRGELTDSNDVVFKVCDNPCKDLCLSNQMAKNLELLMECNANRHENLTGHVTLRLIKEGEDKLQEEKYVFNVLGDRTKPGGDADYDIKQTNEGPKASITKVNYFQKENGYRLY